MACVPVEVGSVIDILEIFDQKVLQMKLSDLG